MYELKKCQMIWAKFNYKTKQKWWAWAENIIGFGLGIILERENSHVE